jgi:hypothetical protein
MSAIIIIWLLLPVSDWPIVMIGPGGLLLVGPPPMNRILFYSLNSSQFGTLGKKGLHHLCEYAKVMQPFLFGNSNLVDRCSSLWIFWQHIRDVDRKLNWWSLFKVVFREIVSHQRNFGYSLHCTLLKSFKLCYRGIEPKSSKTLPSMT